MAKGKRSKPRSQIAATQGTAAKQATPPYFDWNDRFNSLFMEMDHKKYKALELPYKAAFGDILYHPDAVVEGFPEELPKETGFADEAPLEIGYRMAKVFLQGIVYRKNLLS